MRWRGSRDVKSRAADASFAKDAVDPSAAISSIPEQLGRYERRGPRIAA